ncbi:MAG: protein kinase [Caldilineaceae bacterium]
MPTRAPPGTPRTMLPPIRARATSVDRSVLPAATRPPRTSPANTSAIFTCRSGWAQAPCRRSIALSTPRRALVALKVLMPGADPVARSRFRQEARTAMQLRHPHIVRTHEVGELPDRGISYIAMELVQGESLSELLERRQRLSAADACRILELSPGHWTTRTARASSIAT